MARFKLTSKKGLLLCRAQISGKGKPLLLKLAIDTGATRTIIPPESPVEGLLGLGFLKAARVVLDFAQDVIEIK